MNEGEWLNCSDPELILSAAYPAASGRKLRLFACQCVRQCGWQEDQFGWRTMVEMAERLSDGQATEMEVTTAIRGFERTAAGAANAWSNLVSAAAATLHPIAVEAAGIALDQMIQFHLELMSRFDEAGYSAVAKDIFGNPFRPVAFDPRWRTADTVALARGIYDDRAFDRLPLLADALMDAGCADEQVLGHCRSDGPHARGCWVVDLVLGKS